MTTPLGPGVPYVSTAGGLLDSWPTGVDFSTIPANTSALAPAKTAAVENICRSATAAVNGYTNFPLRSQINPEYLNGPDFRATVQNSTRNGRLILQRWPVTQVLSVSVSPATSFPEQWTALPAGSWRIEVPILGSNGSSVPSGSGEGGQAILIAPGFMNWCLGRWGFRIQVRYIHGWPHTALTAAASAGDSTIHVHDITAWGPPSGSTVGAAGTVFDVSSGSQEAINCTAAAPTSGTDPEGPGTLTLASPLAYGHPAGIVVSSLPHDVIWATALYAAADALTRGATATTLRSAPGVSAGASGKEMLIADAKCKLDPFRRTW